jgi:hypothetical protein
MNHSCGKLQGFKNLALIKVRVNRGIGIEQHRALIA